MFPEIWSMTDRIFCNFGRFFPFYPYNTKYQNFEQLKNKPEDIIILHKCTKNHDHMSYCSLDMVRSGCHFYFLFWAIFSHFTSLTARKIKIKKKKRKEKNDWRYHHFTIVHQKSWSYAIAGDRCNYFSFWAIFCTFTPLPNSPKNRNFNKIKKDPRDLIILHRFVKNHDHMLYCSWDMVRDRYNYFSFWAIFCHFTGKKCTVPEIWCAMDRRTDEWMEGWTDAKKWHIEVSAPPKNKKLIINSRHKL